MHKHFTRVDVVSNASDNTDSNIRVPVYQVSNFFGFLVTEDTQMLHVNTRSSHRNNPYLADWCYAFQKAISTCEQILSLVGILEVSVSELCHIAFLQQCVHVHVEVFVNKWACGMEGIELCATTCLCLFTAPSDFTCRASSRTLQYNNCCEIGYKDCLILSCVACELIIECWA